MNTSNLGRLLAISRYLGKIWDGRETVKSPIVWDFSDKWKLGFTIFPQISEKGR